MIDRRLTKSISSHGCLYCVDIIIFLETVVASSSILNKKSSNKLTKYSNNTIKNYVTSKTSYVLNHQYILDSALNYCLFVGGSVFKQFELFGRSERTFDFKNAVIFWRFSIYTLFCLTVICFYLYTIILQL